MRKILVVILALVAILAVPAVASASYNISQRNAQHQVLGIAEQEYSDGWGVTATGSFCRPQGTRAPASGGTYRGYWHRWVCTWVGTDGEGADVYGSFIVAGQSDGSYRYVQIYGGLSWE